MNTCVHVFDNRISSLLGLLHGVRKYVFLIRIFRPEHQGFLFECCSVHSNIRSTCLEFLPTHRAIAYGFGSNNAKHIAHALDTLWNMKTNRRCFFGGKSRVYARRRAVPGRYFIPDPALLTPCEIAATSFVRGSEHLVSSIFFLHAVLTPKTSKLWKRAMANSPWPLLRR